MMMTVGKGRKRRARVADLLLSWEWMSWYLIEHNLAIVSKMIDGQFPEDTLFPLEKTRLFITHTLFCGDDIPIQTN